MKNSYYFPHDYNARNDHKLEELFLKWKCEGRGIYWTLIEMLYENNGYLPIDKIEYYANALQTDSERIASVINDFGLFKKDDKVFWSDSCLRRLSHLEEKREKARQSSFKRWSKDANAMPSLCERNARKESKVKESKVKESKVKEETLYVDFEKSTIASWNLFCLKYPTLSQVKEISAERRQRLKKRFERESFRAFDTILAVIPEQTFLLGENKNKWTISFDWLIANDTNFLKVLEKRYINQKGESDVPESLRKYIKKE